MVYRLGVEQSEPGRWMAWILDLPGCASRAPTRTELPGAAPEAVREYLEWCGCRGLLPSHPSEFVVAEEFACYELSDGYWVNAFFQDDLRAVTSAEMQEVGRLLALSRRDLLVLLKDIPEDLLARPIEGERFHAILGIVRHVAGAEWWYLDRLDLASPQESLPKDSLTMLDAVREHAERQLGRLVENTTVRDYDGERWSARKVVRRMLWHERVHTWHILRVAATLR